MMDRLEIYESAIKKARKLAKQRIDKNKAPSWILTELAQKAGKKLAYEFDVDVNIVLLTLYLQHLVFDQTIGGYNQKNHPDLSVKYVCENNLLEKWNIPLEDRNIILEAIRAHHRKEVSPNLIVEVIKNAECEKFITVEGALVWLHELGVRGVCYEKAKQIVFYKMNQKKELLTLEKCIKRGNESCKRIEEMFESQELIPKLQKLHKLGLDKVPYEMAIKKVEFNII